MGAPAQTEARFSYILFVSPPTLGVKICIFIRGKQSNNNELLILKQPFTNIGTKESTWKCSSLVNWSSSSSWMLTKAVPGQTLTYREQSSGSWTAYRSTRMSSSGMASFCSAASNGTGLEKRWQRSKTSFAKTCDGSLARLPSHLVQLWLFLSAR